MPNMRCGNSAGLTPGSTSMPAGSTAPKPRREDQARRAEPQPHQVDREADRGLRAQRQPLEDDAHQDVGTAMIRDRDGEKDHPDVAEDLQLLAPVERQIEREAAEDL